MIPDQIDFSLLLLRLAIGFVMIAHGRNHIFGGGKIQGTAGWFESLGMRPPRVHAWLASLTELGVGVLLVLGLLTPLAAAGVVGVITVAWITNHLGNGFFIFRKGEGWEWVAALAFSAVALGTMGPGEWSLDEAIGFELGGVTSLGVTLLGAVGALGLLVGFWRPPREKLRILPFAGAVFGAYLVVGGIGLPLIDSGISDVVSEPDQISYGVLILRLVLGVVMIAHGYNHIFGGGKIEGTARWFESLGMKPGILHAWLASLTELGAGAMLIVGLLTPLAAAGVVGVMVVAWVTNHVGNGYFTFRPGEGWEYVSFLAVAAVGVGGIGGGEFSLDYELEILDWFSGFTGLFLALAGVLGAAGLLAVFWRPETVKSPTGAVGVFAFFVVIALLGAVAVPVDDEPEASRGGEAPPSLVASGGKRAT